MRSQGSAQQAAPRARSRCPAGRHAPAGLAVLALLVAASAAQALPVRFTEPAPRNTGDTPVSIATGDFDADGDIDLVTANQDGDSVSVLPGTAAGAFGAAVDTPVGAGPRAVAAGRFDGGGDLDLAVANFDVDTISVLVGGSGTAFTKQPTDIPVGNGPRAIATGLFNADTELDLAVANEHTDNVSVLLGGAGAGFSGSATFAAGGSPSGIVAADFNGDGDPDLAVANLATDDVSVLVGAVGATFMPKVDFAAGDGPRAIVAGDFNGDGDPDLAVANENTDDVSVLLGGAGASFAAPSDFASGDAPTGVAAADFTRDGDPDLAVTNRQAANVSVLVGGPGGGFSAPVLLGAGNGPWAIATGDFNADGEQDLVATLTGAEDVATMLNITAPDTTVVSGPIGAINDTTPAFGLAADEPGVLFECRVDGAPFAACGQLFTTPALADGPHLVEAVAVDPAGNRDATPASRAVTVDTVAPDTSITAGPDGVSRNPVQRFAFASGEAGARFECRLDAAPFAACAPGFTTPALADGAHGFAVRAVDPAGNADPVPAARSFAIDTTPPETTIVAGPAGRTTDLTPTWRFSVERRRVDVRVPDRQGRLRPVLLAVHRGGAQAWRAPVPGPGDGRGRQRRRDPRVAPLHEPAPDPLAHRARVELRVERDDARADGREGRPGRRARRGALSWRRVPIPADDGQAAAEPARGPHRAVRRRAAGARHRRGGADHRARRDRQGRAVPDPQRRRAGVHEPLPGTRRRAARRVQEGP